VEKGDPANYRGISLLSTISKVYRRVLARRLNCLTGEEGCYFRIPAGI
jgi:hypothetical protein